MADVRGGQLEGRIALVTGAVRRIGRAIALALARDGAAVVINARSSRDEADAVGAEIEALAGRRWSISPTSPTRPRSRRWSRLRSSASAGSTS